MSSQKKILIAVLKIGQMAVEKKNQTMDQTKAPVETQKKTQIQGRVEILRITLMMKSMRKLKQQVKMNSVISQY